MDQPTLPPTRKTPIVSITEKLPDTTTVPPSPTPERKSKPRSKIVTLETVLESDAKAQHAKSSDDASTSVTKSTCPTSPNDKEHVAKKRSQYFHDALHERSSGNSAAEVVYKEALVYAEVKTNIKIDNEQHFLTTFSHQLAARYNRYPSSTVVSLHSSHCILFGGSSHPAYTLTITALPSEVQPATNKRNAAVLQKHMEAVLRIPPSRGLVRFIPVAEECLAWGGKTVAGRVSEAAAREKDVANGGQGSKAHDRRFLKSLSLRRSPANITPPSTQPSSPLQEASSAAQMDSADLVREESARVVKKKKSIIHTLFRASKTEGDDSVGS